MPISWGSIRRRRLPTKQFSKRRKVAIEEDLDKMNRLYAVESQFSLTGANADHRLRMKGCGSASSSRWIWRRRWARCRA